MAKVRMLVTTNYKGLKEKEKEYVVDDKVAIRWQNNNIATMVEDTEEEDNELDYSTMKVKQLFALCKERGLEVEPKQDAEVYINALVEYDAQQSE